MKQSNPKPCPRWYHRSMVRRERGDEQNRVRFFWVSETKYATSHRDKVKLKKRKVWISSLPKVGESCNPDVGRTNLTLGVERESFAKTWRTVRRYNQEQLLGEGNHDPLSKVVHSSECRRSNRVVSISRDISTCGQTFTTMYLISKNNIAKWVPKIKPKKNEQALVLARNFQCMKQRMFKVQVPLQRKKKPYMAFRRGIELP